MLISMTGFGKAEVQVNGKTISVEVKSLNSKQLDLNVKVPMIYRDREYEIRNLLSTKLTRGKVDFYINYDEKKENTAAPINAGIFKSYYQQIEAISADCNIPLSNEPVFQTILKLPDVLKIEKVEVSDEEWKALFECINAAIEKMILFRAQEGKALEKDITERVRMIEDLLVKVEPFEKQRLDAVKTKLQDSLKSLKDVKVDNDRFEQEIIYYLEKMDVTEEKVRLRNHCEYFIKTANEDQPVGRKLGFILQEPLLFSGTIRENILYGNPECAGLTDDRLESALEEAGLTELVNRFDKGLDTPVKMTGDGISLGQKQIIAFIRAILRKPELLILDEATANIDTVTEQQLDVILKNLPASTTRVIIAHRLNTIENADEIFFVNTGKIIAAGSFREAISLLKQGKAS